MNKPDKHISLHISSQSVLLAEIEQLYDKMAKFNLYLVVEEYSIVNNRIRISLYDRLGIKICANIIGFCYPMSDSAVYETLCRHLVTAVPEEYTTDFLIDTLERTTLVFVPAHAASLLERINHAYHGLQYAVPYSFVKDWDQFMKSKVIHEEIKFD